LPPSLVVDENCHAGIISLLREKGFLVHSVRESTPGISDDQVLAMAIQNQALLVTEDSDFGELVFSHHDPTVGVIFLRYQPQDWLVTANTLVSVLGTRWSEFFGKFVVLTKNKLRIRDIP